MPIRDVISELNRVRSAGLISDYAIGGAVAAELYIEAGSTVDVDVFVVFGSEPTHPLAPLGPVWADLVAHGAKVEAEYLVITDWPVQLLPPGTPLYDDAIRNARSVPIGDQSGRFMTPEHLAAIALATGRKKDFARVEEFITRGALDVKELETLIQRFGLTQAWSDFQAKYLSSPPK